MMGLDHPSKAPGGEGMTEALLVFSHLRWNFVFQRPQHLLSRLASARRVIFFEEPVAGEHAEAFIQYSSPETSVLVCKPHTPSPKPGFHDEQLPHLMELVKVMLRDLNLKDYILWFYTPMALPLVKVLDPRGIVYDCMDELSAFMDAPPQLIQLESDLLNLADIVFTGGPSLYRAKKDRNPNVHCFPSSVDRAHFSCSRTRPVEPHNQREIPHPRLGYFGVLDERLDLALLNALALAHPEWQIVMIGPVVKIDENKLPKHDNIHYLGQQQYVDLPHYLASWDLCLLPFALNNATRFISPTKTLEYMSAEKQIVTTPITDVAEPYREIVFLGNDAQSFISACETALALKVPEKKRRIAAMREVLSRTSWDRTVDAMNDILLTIFEPQPRRKGGQGVPHGRSGGLNL